MQRFRGDNSLRLIEFVLYKERDIRLAVYEAKNATSAHTGGAPSGHAYIADPTAVQAVRNSVELPSVTFPNGKTLYWPERWLAVVDKLRKWTEDRAIAGGILYDRYHFVPYQITCIRLNISHGTYKNHLKMLRYQAKIIAAKFDLIDV